MSYGTNRTFKTKAELRRRVAEVGAENVGVFGTSLFGNETAETVADLAGTSAVIVGPDVYNRRNWYANVVRKSDGTITIK
jgi:predicted esterase YcpF (UPF0227 family)